MLLEVAAAKEHLSGPPEDLGNDFLAGSHLDCESKGRARLGNTELGTLDLFETTKALRVAALRGRVSFIEGLKSWPPPPCDQFLINV